jgi:hypothetical protein
MNLSQYLTRRNIIIAGVILLVLIGLLWLFSLGRGTQTRDITYTKLAFQYPLAAATRSSDNALVFSNGRSFVAWQQQTGEVSTLTNESTLPSIGTLLLRPDGKGALFQSINHTVNDALASRLLERSLLLDEPYWWYVNFENSAISLVTYPQTNQPVQFRSAAWIDNTDFIGMTPTGSQTEVTAYDGFDKLRSQYQINGVVNSFVAQGDQLVYHVGNQIAQSSIDADDATQLLTNVGTASFSPQTDWVFAIEPAANSNASLGYLYNLQTQQKLFESRLEEAVATWAHDGATVFITSEGDQAATMRSINVETLRQTLYKSERQVALTRVVHAQNADLFIAVDDGFDMYLASDNDVNAQSFTVPEDLGIIQTENASVEYFSDEGYFIANIVGSNNAQARKQITDALRQKGVTPEMVQIRYVSQPMLRDGPR